MINPAQKVVDKAKQSKNLSGLKAKLAAKKAGTAPAKEKPAPAPAKKPAPAPAKEKQATVKEKLAVKKPASTPAKKPAPAPAKPAPAPAKPAPAPAKPAPVAETPAMQKKKMVSKKTVYDIKEASNPKLKASARKNYAMNAEASMKNKKKK